MLSSTITHGYTQSKFHHSDTVFSKVNLILVALWKYSQNWAIQQNPTTRVSSLSHGLEDSPTINLTSILVCKEHNMWCISYLLHKVSAWSTYFWITMKFSLTLNQSIHTHSLMLTLPLTAAAKVMLQNLRTFSLKWSNLKAPSSSD